MSQLSVLPPSTPTEKGGVVSVTAPPSSGVEGGPLRRCAFAHLGGTCGTCPSTSVRDCWTSLSVLMVLS